MICISGRSILLSIPLLSSPLLFCIFTFLFAILSGEPAALPARRFRNFEFYENKRRERERERGFNSSRTRFQGENMGGRMGRDGQTELGLGMDNWTKLNTVWPLSPESIWQTGWTFFVGSGRSFSKNIEKSTCIKGQMEIVVLTMLRDWNSGPGIFLVIDSSLSKAFSGFVSTPRLRVNWEEIYRYAGLEIFFFLVLPSIYFKSRVIFLYNNNNKFQIKTRTIFHPSWKKIKNLWLSFFLDLFFLRKSSHQSFSTRNASSISAFI